MKKKGLSAQKGDWVGLCQAYLALRMCFCFYTIQRNTPTYFSHMGPTPETRGFYKTMVIWWRKISWRLSWSLSEWNKNHKWNLDLSVKKSLFGKGCIQQKISRLSGESCALWKKVCHLRVSRVPIYRKLNFRKECAMLWTVPKRYGGMGKGWTHSSFRMESFVASGTCQVVPGKKT